MIRTFFLLVQGLLAAALAGQVMAAARVTTPQVRAELLAHAPEGLAPGKPMWLGLSIEHQPDWHTYWKNPGDSGLPTRLEWQLGPGAQAGEIRWPTPKKLPVGPLMNFGYDGRVLLAVPLTLAQPPAGDSLEVRLKADWLVCKDVCIPESGEFALSVPVKAASAGHAALFAQAEAALPRTLAGARASARVEGGQLQVDAQGLPPEWRGKALDFLPETAGVIANAEKPRAQWNGERWTARITLDPQRSESPGSLPVVLVAEGQATGVQVQLAVTTPWPAVGGGPSAAAPASAPDSPAAAVSASVGGSLLASLVFALLGGALLNLMPCVFPVLSLKVFGFAAHAQDRRALLLGALAYTGGVVASFVALAGLLLALRAGGEQLGWGFQLQSPLFVAALAALFTLIGLNLAGLFEIGSVLPARWSAARARHPMADSALTGVLAVAVASPCTAPFMGASLGLAVTLPAVQALAVFAALGLGMALPYVLVSAWPAIARALPRPGPWMAHFRTLMAFPMFATVVWLVWVLGQQTGIDGAAALLGTLVALAFVAWALGSPGLGPKARAGFGASSLILLAAALAWALPALRGGETTVDPAAGARAGDGGIAWQDWSPQRVAESLAQGRPVFVDFTAAWCVTCQYNKRTTLASDEVREAFAAKQVVLMRADWTRRDPRITAELARLGRSGVPVYALHRPGSASPQLLGEILSVAEIRQALAVLP